MLGVGAVSPSSKADTSYWRTGPGRRPGRPGLGQGPRPGCLRGFQGTGHFLRGQPPLQPAPPGPLIRLGPGTFVVGPRGGGGGAVFTTSHRCGDKPEGGWWRGARGSLIKQELMNERRAIGDTEILIRGSLCVCVCLWCFLPSSDWLPGGHLAPQPQGLAVGEPG